MIRLLIFGLVLGLTIYFLWTTGCSEDYKAKVVERAIESWERDYQDLIKMGVKFTHEDA